MGIVSHQSTMNTLVTSSFVLSLVVLAHGSQKRAASCDIDTSLPCECTNPFLGTDNFFLGDAKQNCKSAKACYVKNLSGCSDARQARGGGRCQSKLACAPEGGHEPVVIPAKPKLPQQAQLSLHPNQNVHQLEAPGSASARSRASAATTSARWTASLTATT